jgi:hypothetical protein
MVAAGTVSWHFGIVHLGLILVRNVRLVIAHLALHVVIGLMPRGLDALRGRRRVGFPALRLHPGVRVLAVFARVRHAATNHQQDERMAVRRMPVAIPTMRAPRHTSSPRAGHATAA